MIQDKLWAPWRINYIQARKTKRCIFCESIKNPKKDFVLIKAKYAAAMLNTFPYNNGHIMVYPIRHTANIEGLCESEILDLFRTTSKVKKLLDKLIRPQGYNIGINLSRAAGAGITGHLHIHIVPRWVGDTNFMPVIFNTKVISQSLKELYKKLKHANISAN